MKGLTIILLFFATVAATTGCSKKETGVCYCKYVSGDKKEFNLKGLDRAKAQDSCNVLDGKANAFGGECELE